MLRRGNAQNRAVAQPGGKVDAPFIERCGIARAFSGTTRKRFLDFFTIRMVFHGRSFGIAVIKHGAIRGNPSDAVCATKPVEIFHAALCKPLGDVNRLGLQLRLNLLAKVFIKHAENQDEASEQHRCGNKENGAENSCRHASSPPIL